MKTMMYFLLALSLQSGYLLSNTTRTISDPDKPATAQRTWKTADKQLWQGGYLVWYKLDTKTNTVKYSNNRKKWKTAENAAWQDQQGNWLFIYQGKLMTNANGTWTETPNQAWQDFSGRWYRFTPDWTLEETISDQGLAGN